MTADAWAIADPCACPVCGRDACEEHLPSPPSSPRPPLVAFTLDELARHTFPARKAILCRDGVAVFSAGHLGQIYAERGVGKTWLVQTLALIAAGGPDVSALGFTAPEPSRVLHLDGEMASEELKERFLGLNNRLRARVGDRLKIIGADWQDHYLSRADTPEGQAALEPFVAAADFIILDNRSCLFDPESEKDAVAWQPAQDWLLSLRRRGKAVLLAHHSNRAGGARGHSKSEDALNLILKLARPDDYTHDQGARFVVTFEKARGVHGPAVAPFAAKLTADGWCASGVELGQRQQTRDKLRDYLRLAAAAGERPKSANTAIQKAGVNRNAGLEQWAAMLKAEELVKHPDGWVYVGR